MGYLLDLTPEEIKILPEEKVAGLIFVHRCAESVVTEKKLSEEQVNTHLFSKLFPSFTSFESIPAIHTWDKDPQDHKSFFSVLQKQGWDKTDLYNAAYLFTDIGLGEIAVIIIISQGKTGHEEII